MPGLQKYIFTCISTDETCSFIEYLLQNRLRVYIDENLSWSSQIENLTKSVASGIGTLWSRGGLEQIDVYQPVPIGQDVSHVVWMLRRIRTWTGRRMGNRAQMRKTTITAGTRQHDDIAVTTLPPRHVRVFGHAFVWNPSLEAFALE